MQFSSVYGQLCVTLTPFTPVPFECNHIPFYLVTVCFSLLEIILSSLGCEIHLVYVNVNQVDNN